MTLNEELSAAVSKHLPSVVGEQLKMLLAEGEHSKRKLDTERGLNAALSKRVAELEAREKQELELQKLERELAKRETAVVEREISCRVAEAVMKERDARLADLKEVTLAVFANNRYKHTVTEDVIVPMQGQNGCPGYTVTVPTTKKIEGES